MYKKITLFVIAVFLFGAAFAQGSVDLHFNGMGFLDNREYSAFVERSRTYSGTRTQIDFGLNIDSLNHFIVGANAIHEFGAQPFFLTADPVAYYNFTNKKWLFNIGEFPREGLVSQYPRAMLNDTLMYYRPNIQGILTSYYTEYGYETLLIDWISRQTNTDREQFIFGALGTYLPNPKGSFFLSHYFYMLHDAGAAILLPNDHINDNGAFQLRAGLDFSHKTAFDSLKVDAGFMMSLERERGVDGFKTPKGFVASAYLSYHRIAFYDEIYAGQGHHLDFGDAFYQKTFYNRLDVIYTPFLFKHIKGQFVFSFHQSPGFTGDSQQAFRLVYDFGRIKLANINTSKW